MSERMVFVFPNGMKMALRTDDMEAVWKGYQERTGKHPKTMSSAEFADRIMERLQAGAERIE